MQEPKGPSVTLIQTVQGESYAVRAVPLIHTDAYEAYSCLTEDQIVSAAAKVLSDEIVTRGYKVIWKQEDGKQFSETDEDKQLKNDYFMPFIRDALQALFTIGVVPIDFYRCDAGYIVPRVPSFGTYDIDIITLPNANRLYTFKYKPTTTSNTIRSDADALAEGLPRPFVLDGFGYDPTKDGKLASIAHTLVPIARLRNEYQSLFIDGWRVRVNPTLVIQDMKDGRKNPLPFTDSVGDRSLAEVRADETYQETELNAEKMQTMQTMYSQWMSTWASIRNQFTNNPTNRGPTPQTSAPWLNNMLRLAPGDELTNVTLPNLHLAFADINESLYRAAATRFGLPLYMLRMEGAYQEASGMHYLQEALARNMRSWQQVVRRILHIVYKMIYRAEFATQLSLVLDNVFQVGDEHGTINMPIEAATRAFDGIFELEFPCGVYTDPDAILSFLQNGLIDYQTAVRYAHAYVSKDAPNSIPKDPPRNVFTEALFQVAEQGEIAKQQADMQKQQGKLQEKQFEHQKVVDMATLKADAEAKQEKSSRKRKHS